MSSVRNQSVFAAAPVWSGSQPFFDEFFGSWRRVAHRDVTFCIGENNLPRPGIAAWVENSAFVRHPGDCRIEVVDTQQGWHQGWQPLTQTQNKLRSTFLETDCEFLYLNETSRPSPPNLISDLFGFRKSVIGAIYKSTYNPGFFTAWNFDPQRNQHLYDAYAQINEITEPRQVTGLGFGAILIHRDVVQKVEFRSGKYAADTCFAIDLSRLSIPIFAAPIVIENLKIDRNPDKLQEWNEARQVVLGCTASGIKGISERLYSMRVKRALDDIWTCIQPGKRFVLIDSDEWHLPKLIEGRHRVVFPERNGQYGGPVDDDAGIRAFDTLSRRRTEYAVFGWPAFWYFGCYPKLASRLRSTYRCLLANDRAVVFDLQRPAKEHPDD